MEYHRKPVSQLKKPRELSRRESSLSIAREPRALGQSPHTEFAGANERVAEGPVTPTLNLADFRSELADFDFEGPVR